MGVETGGKVFDPLGLSKIASAETLAWYRAAELKHSRIAMVRARPALPHARAVAGGRGLDRCLPGRRAPGLLRGTAELASAAANL